MLKSHRGSPERRGISQREKSDQAVTSADLIDELLGGRIRDGERHGRKRQDGHMSQGEDRYRSRHFTFLALANSSHQCEPITTEPITTLAFGGWINKKLFKTHSVPNEFYYDLAVEYIVEACSRLRGHLIHRNPFSYEADIAAFWASKRSGISMHVLKVPKGISMR